MNESARDLFIIEKSGDDNAYNAKVEELNTKQLQQDALDTGRLRKASNSYTLFKRLESTSKVEPVRSKVGPKERRKTVHNDDKKLVKFWNEKKSSIQKAKSDKAAKKQAALDPNKRFDCYNLWGDEDKKENQELEASEDFLKEFEKVPKKVPDHLHQKPSLLPAIEVPAPGQSYNPDEEEHAKLLNQEVQREIEMLKEEKRWANKVEKFYVPKSEMQSQQQWLVEMSEGLFEYGNDEADDQNTEEEMTMAQTLEAYAKQAMPKSKTRKVRRRELAAKLAKKQKEKEKKLKTKENEVFRLRTFKKELNERDEQIKRRAAARAKRHIESMYQPKRLSQHKYEDNGTEVALPSNLSGSLRSLKVEGNILTDRFKSLQRRNLLETRVPIITRRRKFQLKKEMKRRHRDGPDDLKDEQV